MGVAQLSDGGMLPLDAYGNGGFRVNGAFREGSILLLPNGPQTWPVSQLSELATTDLDPLFAIAKDLEFVLIGCGTTLRPLPQKVGAAFDAIGLGAELMNTGSACRTYNHLMSEGRIFAAALIAVD